MKNTSAKAVPNPPKREHLKWTGRASLFFLAGLLMITILMVERGPAMGSQEFMIGEPSPRTFFSPLDLVYINEKLTDDLRYQKMRQLPPILVSDPSVARTLSEKTDRFFKALAEIKEAKASGVKPPLEKLPFEISGPSLDYLLEQPLLDEVHKHVEVLLAQTLKQGVVDDHTKVAFLEGDERLVTVIDSDEKSEVRVEPRNLMAFSEAAAAASRLLPEAVQKNRNLKNAVLEIFQGVTVSNLSFDDAETKARRKRAAESVSPVEETIKKEELIVQRGMLITPEVKSRLDQIQKKLTKREVLNKLMAVSLLVFLTIFLCFTYLYSFERKSLLSIRTILLIQSVFIISVLLCKLFSIWPGGSPYLMPTALPSLLLILLARARLGILSAMMMAVLASPLAAFEPEVIIATLLTSAAGTFAALRVRKRIQFLKVGSSVGLTYFLVLLAFQIFHTYPPTLESFQISALGLANGLLITTPLLFLLPTVFESIFNLTTDITLLELSDLNHPLLKRMVVEAPGTYHHSLVVSTLAEAACEAIHANALLARVGCYFHDIGKIARAEFFTENQPSQEASKHEKLTPTMSCLVIMNHVKDGIELGQRYKLKESILRFIPEHQGTTVVYFFYKKALDQAKRGEPVSPDDFRYPGPKPQSKETAVALLADSTEAASRSMRNPTPESVRQLVRKIINDKFIDGQLDECDLTLKDLYKIQETFVTNLLAIFHTRVSYPVTPQTPDSPDLFEEDQFSKYRLDS